MTHQELASLVDKLRYKKAKFDWAIIQGSFVIRLQIKCPDVYTAQIGPVTVQSYLPVDIDLERFKTIIYNLVTELELHEVKEWLTLDGIQMVNPHPRTQKECNPVPAYEILDNQERGMNYANGLQGRSFGQIIYDDHPAMDYGTAYAIGARKRPGSDSSG